MNPIDMKQYYLSLLDNSAALRMHLQWFAAEDEGRTEDPTEYKLRKAREDGKVAKSPDLVQAVVLLFTTAAIGFLAKYELETMTSLVRYFLQVSAEYDITTDLGIGPAFITYFVKLTVPIAAVAFISAFLGNVLQVGFLFSVKPITPDLKRIAPNFARYFQRSFASTEALFNLGKSVFKIVIMGIIVFINIQGTFPRLANMMRMTLMQGVGLISNLAFTILVECALALLVLSLPDYFFQRRQHLESLKMSKQEVKEERKMLDGDPLVKNRMRERMRELLSRNMVQQVPKADVVVTNPTHYAVALEWNRQSMPAPMVTAKGVDTMAQKIKAVANEHGVPIIENKPFARALYAEVELGEVIPEKYYQVMATILAEVYKMKGKVDRAV